MIFHFDPFFGLDSGSGVPWFERRFKKTCPPDPGHKGNGGVLIAI